MAFLLFVLILSLEGGKRKLHADLILSYDFFLASLSRDFALDSLSFLFFFFHFTIFLSDFFLDFICCCTNLLLWRYDFV